MYHHYTSPLTCYSSNIRLITLKQSRLNNETEGGWISPSTYNKLQLYLQLIKSIQANISKIVRAVNGKYVIEPFNKDYIQWVKNKTYTDYPYSSWNCSITSNKERGSHEYCLLTNIYFISATNTYYYYRHPSENKEMSRDQFMSSHGGIQIHILDNITMIKQLGIAAILTQLIHMGGAPDWNYAHGFLERCGPLFWVLSECQSHPMFVDPSKIQLYYSSKMDTDHGNTLWQPMKRLSDGTYEHTSQWNKVLYAMFSIYPLLTYKSFDQATVMFKHIIFTGSQDKRSAAWGIYYEPMRPRSYYPFEIQHYRRAYLAYSEWILNNFGLHSKFELTSIQKRLQESHRSEEISFCYERCQNKWFSKPSTTERTFTGEWIVVLNRAGVGRRELKNANKLIQALLKAFPDHTNPYLRVWPKQFNFDDDLYETVRMARSIRVLIGVHGAGLSNTLFMRPGTILYEINPPGCRLLSFNFRRWAEVFNLQYGLWSPGDKNDYCKHDAATTVNVDEVVSDVINLIQDENQYRSGYLSRALEILVNE
ncbi:unnamed protein product [Rotaria sordida]|uniref:Glycosyltransferase 61 catalytic domain-containing protein n=1 Tax=Rotaria sordida TaxID=392033 RepID=A0A818TEW0_9BILA|nr:unnamed protein product [Rotaria sordida]CAF3682784.1 unnamed protein product [Rotaria sordida]